MMSRTELELVIYSALTETVKGNRGNRWRVMADKIAGRVSVAPRGKAGFARQVERIIRDCLDRGCSAAQVVSAVADWVLEQVTE